MGQSDGARREEAMTKYQNLWEKERIFGLYTLGNLITDTLQ
jgi:hypothetical protein